MVMELVFGTQPVIDPETEIKRDAVGPAELGIRLQTKGFERCAQLQVRIPAQVIADIGTVDGVFSAILKPKAGIKEGVIIIATGIDAKGIKTQVGWVAVITAAPVFITIVGA
ncbi:Uncharacterised protein [Serratia quinivorans]|nr:Uncharacterised protein [Serratia quinivorans]